MAASSFWKRAAEDDKPPGSSSRAVAGGAQSAWGEGPRRPRGGGNEKHGGGYVLDEGYGNGGASLGEYQGVEYFTLYVGTQGSWSASTGYSGLGASAWTFGEK